MKFIQQISLYTFVGFIGAGINFFIMPVLSHYLSPADYGLLSLFNTYVTILIPIVSLLANSILSIEYFKEKNKKTFSDKFASLQIVPVITSLLLSILVWQFYSRSAHLLELQGTSLTWGFIIVLITFCTIYVELFFSFLIIEKKAILYAIYTLFRVFFEVSLTLFFVIYKQWNWEGRMYAWLITSIVFMTAAFLYFYRKGYIRGKLHLPFIKTGILFGLPLILHTVGKFVINQSDRIFIAKMISLEEAGIYNIGYTMGMLIMIVINAFFNFYTPFLLERLADLTDEKKIQIVRMNYLYSIAIIVILVLLTFITPYFFGLLVDTRYNSGIKYVFWVGLGYVFWGGYMLFALYINYFNKNKILGWLALMNVATNLLFNYFFIKWVGAIGAAYATALSFFLVFIIIAYKANQLVQLPWLSIKKIFPQIIRK
jgi:O-antigen/teichoic acid export membrane protein